MHKNKQRGFGTVQIVIAVIILTVIAGLLWERHSLMADNKKLAGDLEVSQENLKTATDANKGLKLDLKLEKELSAASRDQAQAHQSEEKAQEKKYAAIEKKLPTPVKKQPGVLPSAEEQQRSLERVTLLWEAFCVDNPSEQCTVKEKAA